MPPRKRARAVAVSSPFDTASSSSPTVVLRQSEGTATNEALAKLSTFRRGGKFSDVTVRAGGVDFPGHRVVLASGSDYLDALFSAGMSDSQSAVVTIDDVPPSVLEAVLDFIYDGRCSIPEQALPSILEAAARLQVPSLQAIVIDEITSRLSPENSLAFWTVGERFTLPGLVAAATDAAATRFADLASSEALLEASHSQLLALFQCERLVVDEEVVFNALRRWSDHAQPAPAELYTLLAHVRFGCMSAAFLKDDVRSWAPMQLAEAKDLLLDALMPLCTTPATVNHLKRRVPQSRISWRTFDENMLATIGPSGQTRIERQDARRWDVALGEGAMTNGVHRWSVCVPNFEYCALGVATEEAKHQRDCGTRHAWTLYLSNSAGSEYQSLDSDAEHGKAVDGFSLGGPLHGAISVLLDMDSRTLSFAREEYMGGSWQLAYTELPGKVWPYLCGGSRGVLFYQPADADLQPEGR